MIGPHRSSYTPAAARVDAMHDPPGTRVIADQLPVLPPSLRSTRISSMRAAGSTALIMS